MFHDRTQQTNCCKDRGGCRLFFIDTWKTRGSGGAKFIANVRVIDDIPRQHITMTYLASLFDSYDQIIYIYMSYFHAMFTRNFSLLARIHTEKLLTCWHSLLLLDIMRGKDLFGVGRGGRVGCLVSSVT